jgi:hypothetical protein
MKNAAATSRGIQRLLEVGVTAGGMERLRLGDGGSEVLTVVPLRTASMVLGRLVDRTDGERVMLATHGNGGVLLPPVTLN